MAESNRVMTLEIQWKIMECAWLLQEVARSFEEIGKMAIRSAFLSSEFVKARMGTGEQNG